MSGTVFCGGRYVKANITIKLATIGRIQKKPYLPGKVDYSGFPPQAEYPKSLICRALAGYLGDIGGTLHHNQRCGQALRCSYLEFLARGNFRRFFVQILQAAEPEHLSTLLIMLWCTSYIILGIPSRLPGKLGFNT